MSAGHGSDLYRVIAASSWHAVRYQHIAEPCACHFYCGDVPEEDDPGTVCKGLQRKPEPPVVEVVLVDRRTGEVI